MAKSKFQYNSKTLRFERTKISVLAVLGSGVCYPIFGFLFFVGLILLQNLIVETPIEKSCAQKTKTLKNIKLYWQLNWPNRTNNWLI